MGKIPKVLRGEMKSRTDTHKNTIIPEREIYKFRDLVPTGNKPNEYRTRLPVTYVNIKHDKIGGKQIRVLFYNFFSLEFTYRYFWQKSFTIHKTKNLPISTKDLRDQSDATEKKASLKGILIRISQPMGRPRVMEDLQLLIKIMID
jgi:hypothetical protein